MKHKDFLNKTILHFALERGNIKFVQILMTKGNIDINIKTILKKQVLLILYLFQNLCKLIKKLH